MKSRCEYEIEMLRLIISRKLLSANFRQRRNTYTVINNIDNNKNKEIYINIINYLNNKCNTRYRYNTPNTKRHINARLNDGYTEQDFYTVISKKADEWLGTEQEKYLRPDTLFGSKFESYLNQQISKKKTQVDEWGAYATND